MPEAEYRRYAALVEYWWGFWRMAREWEEDERQRRRAERLPCCHSDWIWERVEMKTWDTFSQRWRTAYDWRARS